MPGTGTTVLGRVQALLGSASSQVVCHGALEALPELAQLGVWLGGHLEDPKAAGALLWPPLDGSPDGAAHLSLKKLQATVCSRFKVRGLGWVFAQSHACCSSLCSGHVESLGTPPL